MKLIARPLLAVRPQLKTERWACTHGGSILMRTPTVTLGAILYLTLTTHTFALECPPFPQQVSKDWGVEVNAAVGKIGPVKGVELKTRTQNATKDLLSKVPDADKVYLEQMMLAAYCTALRDDKTISEANKAKQLKNYFREVRNAISKSQQPTGKGLAPVQKKTNSGESNNKYGISNDMYNKLLEITNGQTRTIEALIGKLNEKDNTLKERDEKIEILARQYAELKREYETKIHKENLSEKAKADLTVAKEKLDAGDLEGANRILTPGPPIDVRVK